MSDKLNKSQNSEESRKSPKILDSDDQKDNKDQREEQNQQRSIHNQSQLQQEQNNQNKSQKHITQSRLEQQDQLKQSQQLSPIQKYSVSILMNEQKKNLDNKNIDKKEQNQIQQYNSAVLNKKQKDKDQVNTLTNLNRLNHLEQIFKHYCTHIFRVGKHMTFERLEYEKIHMTIERFFVFLKDFELTTGIVGDSNKTKEIVPKASVVMLFKKISPNAKDLTFQQFIECIEKLAIVYEDNYNTLLIEPKDKVNVALGLKKIPKKRINFNQNDEQNRQSNQKIQHNDEQKQQDLQEMAENAIKQIQSKLGFQDELQQQLTQRKEQKQLKQAQSKSLQKTKVQPISVPQLTKQQKINKFYKKIGVDSVKEYRNKMGYLNLPLFRPAVKSVEAKPRHSPLHTEQQKSQLRKLQEAKQKMKKFKQQSPQKQILNDPQVKRMHDEVRNKRYQSLFNQKSRDKLNKRDNERQITRQHQIEQELQISNTVELKKKKRVYNSIKVTQQVSRAMLQKLGIKQSARDTRNQDQDQDDKYLAQYKVPYQSQPEHQRMKPSISQRLVGERGKKEIISKNSNNHLGIINYDKNNNKLILNRKKSKSSAPAPSPYNSNAPSTNPNHNPNRQDNTSIPKVQKIVNDTKKRALEMRKQQKFEQQNKNELIKKIGRAKFLSKNK